MSLAEMYPRTRSTDARQRLRRTLRHEVDGQRTAVLVLGDGVNREAARSPSSPSPDAWTDVVEQLWRDTVGTTASPVGSSRTVQWTRLVRMSAAARDLSLAESRSDIAKRASRLILDWEKRTPADAPLYEAIMDAGFAHIVSMNVDRQLVLGQRGARLRGYQNGTWTQRRVVRRTERGTVSVWYPYGIAHQPESLELDHGCHAIRLMSAEGHRDGAMEEWRVRDEWPRTDIHLREPEQVYRRMWPDLDWYQLFLVAPLVCVGTSLSQDDWPLWWLLSQRHRTLVPFRKVPNPSTFVLHTRADPLEHLHGQPAGIETIRFQSYDTLWRFLLHELGR